MKTKLFATTLGLIFILSFSSALAQTSDPVNGDDSVKCVENGSLYYTFFSQGNYKDAVDPWRYVFYNCPKFKQRIYLDGIDMMKKLMKDETDAVKQDKYVDTMMMIYDQRIQYFGREGYVRGRQGVDYFNFRRKTDNEKAYGYLSKSVELEKGKTEPAVLVKYMQSSALMHNKQTITDDQFVANFVITSDAIHEQIVAAPTDSTLNKANEMILSILLGSKLGTCEKLIPIFEKMFETNKEVGFIRSIVTALSTKDCVDSDIFYKAIMELDKTEPSEISKKNLAKLSEKRNLYSDAIGYYKQAIELSGSDLAKGNYYLEMAKIAGSNLNSYATARTYAYQARDLNSELSPNAYILIATFYANAASSCSSNEYEKGMVYLLAYDMVQKAKNYKMSDGMGQKANELMATFKNNFPKTEDIFFNGDKVGGSKTIGCWINETTTIRARE